MRRFTLNSTRRGLLAALLSVLIGFTVACGGGTDQDVEATTTSTASTDVAATGGGASEETEPPQPSSVSESGGGPDPDPGNGEQLFQMAGCASCHALAAAGATGDTGPDLDEAEPSFEDAVDQITNGGGGMPAFKDQLDKAQIEDLAAFVVESTKG
jgi:cytochrome c553